MVSIESLVLNEWNGNFTNSILVVLVVSPLWAVIQHRAKGIKGKSMRKDEARRGPQATDGNRNNEIIPSSRTSMDDLDGDC